MARKNGLFATLSHSRILAIVSKVREGSPGGRSETTEVGLVKQVGFKPGVKEREFNLDQVII